MTDLTALKSAAREAAFERRGATHRADDAPLRNASANEKLMEVLAAHKGKVIGAYMPMRSEIDPLPAMTELAASSQIAVPVIEANGQPLKFALWTPDTTMTMGTFGARIPADCQWVEPEVLIAPLVAFDRAGGRLGYGGGFYDRTLEGLRAKRPTLALGFAWAAQEATDLPLEDTDQPLDYIVTEREVITF
ncbi:5-formyltetrahydrofolate cyclo-ligase [Halocynthiibacter styelae]|uniref:5-formyltetrahydrofolate cyclo-ligase n=1 Tax=Halocynthiibacter styelae TaxID=2761955 RepID=A0A8J7IUL6_9RHOB|nr:5-formyltetrahydrofolate cyclo-ligase [Paenihalocynthiibacter styelae]MBI1492723.1 5-formyltetrahydrofolate cyclo-ligase [Paenihalocynthiibacter styelae]